MVFLQIRDAPVCSLRASSVVGKDAKLITYRTGIAACSTEKFLCKYFWMTTYIVGEFPHIAFEMGLVEQLPPIKGKNAQIDPENNN